ncbi:MAG: methionyl-tRNA formyltransferase [Bacteroidota bacterium]
MRIGLLVSGNLGYVVLKYLNPLYQIDFVLTDKKSSEIINFCTDNNINHFVGNPRNGKAYSFVSNMSIDLIISVNYIFIIEKDIIELPTRLAFNIHGSLLPKYRGRTPHVWSIINNEKYTGITAHKIDEGCDTGDIIEQFKIEINQNDTGASILNKYAQQYVPLIESVILKIKNNSVVFLKQEHIEATYFGVRTPDDGKIDWNWQRERIRNWVRAQASPYPGAFSFCQDEKIIVDEIVFSNYGFHADMPNGLIISLEPLLVKTPNGVVELTIIRNKKLNIKEGYKLI